MHPRFLLTLMLWPAAACGSPSRPPGPEPALPAAERSNPRDEEIVAFFNGEGLSWRRVAEKTLELNLKAAVDGYVRWRVVEDRKKALGIVNPPEELRRRAETTVRQTRERFGAEEFKAQLAREGLTEAAYLDYVSRSGQLETVLTVEKIVRYAAMREDSLEIDRMMFVDEKDARAFAKLQKEKGFDAAAEEMKQAGQKQTIARRPREIFPKSQPPAEPPLDGWIVEALLKLKPGDVTDVETSRSNLYYVIRLAGLRPARDISYADARQEILEGILQAPPAPREVERWVESEFARSKVEYGDPRARKGAPK